MHSQGLSISIVTPSFNQGDYIEETIRSVLDQGYKNLEYIVIDGGSTDKTKDVLEKYSARLHYIQSQPDGGHGNALNQGFSRSTGEVMGWLNSDDKYYPWTLATVSQIFERFPQVHWIVGLNSWFNKDGAAIKVERHPKNVFDFLLGDFAWIQQESVFWRRGLWERAGARINEDFKLMVDGELWSRFFLYEQLYSVDCLLGGYRSHGENRASLHYERCLLEMEEAIETMRESVGQSVLDKDRLLIALRKQARSRFLNLPIIQRISSRRIRHRLREFSYLNIRHTPSGWKVFTLPFRPDLRAF